MVHYSNNMAISGEHAVEFPFPYTNHFYCGRVDGPEFIDGNFGSVTQVGRRILVNGRFKL